MRKQSKEYKLKIKQQKQILEQVPQQEEIIQPVVQELEVEVLEGQRRCTICGEVKDIKTGFYVKRHQCISCVREYELRVRTEINTKYKMENGGSERVPQKPGVYADEYQEAQVTEFLTLVGWKLNPNGVWSKKGFKTKDKVWEKPIKKFKRVGTKNQHGNERSAVYLKRLELIELRERGMTFQKIADIYDISPATVLRIIRDDYGK
jgi:predicted transcriptional regulator